MGNSVISMVVLLILVRIPLHLKLLSVVLSIVPCHQHECRFGDSVDLVSGMDKTVLTLNPLYQGVMASSGSLFIILRRLSTMSMGL